ncbi:MAG: hypothetical protein QXW97_00320 [Candidatus Pacearchaeota archaeon]
MKKKEKIEKSVKEIKKTEKKEIKISFILNIIGGIFNFIFCIFLIYNLILYMQKDSYLGEINTAISILLFVLIFCFFIAGIFILYSGFLMRKGGGEAKRGATISLIFGILTFNLLAIISSFVCYLNSYTNLTIPNKASN